VRLSHASPPPAGILSSVSTTCLPIYVRAAWRVARRAREASLRARGCAWRVVPRSNGPGGVPRYELVALLPSTASLQRLKNHPRRASSAAG